MAAVQRCFFRTRGKPPRVATEPRASEESRGASQHFKPGQRPGELSPSSQGLKCSQPSQFPKSKYPSVEIKSAERKDQRATQGRAHEHASPRIGIAVPSQSPRVAGPAARNISIQSGGGMEGEEKLRKNFALAEEPRGR